MKEFIKQITFIILFSLIIGLGVNFPLIKRYFRGEFRYGFLSIEKFPSIVFINLAEADDLFSKGKALFIDSRAKETFQAGHILGAINIPFMEQKEERSLDLLSLSLERTLVVYCDGNRCQSSVGLAKILNKKGFKDIKIFFGGWAEWLMGGLPISSEDDSQ